MPICEYWNSNTWLGRRAHGRTRLVRMVAHRDVILVVLEVGHRNWHPVLIFSAESAESHERLLKESQLQREAI